MSTSQRTATRYLIFDGTTTGISNGSSIAYFADDFKNAVLEVTAQAGSTLTIKVVASNFSREDNTNPDEDYPNFGAADSITNPWSYISMVDLDTRAAITGSTGYSYAAAGGTKKFNIETDQMKWFGVEISGLSAGGARVQISFVDNR